MKTKNTNRLLLLGALGLFLTLFASCDTREDYFFKYGEKPVITLHSDKDTLIFGEKYVIINLHWGEEAYIDFDFFDAYNSSLNDFDYSILGYGIRGGNYYFNHDTQQLNFENIPITVDKNAKKIYIEEKTKSAYDFYIKNDNIMPAYSPSPIYFSIRLELKNAIGVIGYAYIHVNIFLNALPSPSISILDDPDDRLIKTISVRGNDPDGDEIIAYEYCIDGSVQKFGGYEFIYDNVKAGNAAWGGTYITATTLDQITHAFQISGYHHIYVRCQDQWGAWSDWELLTIII